MSNNVFAGRIVLPPETLEQQQAVKINNAMRCGNISFYELNQLEEPLDRYYAWGFIKMEIEKHEESIKFEQQLYEKQWRLITDLLESDNNSSIEPTDTDFIVWNTTFSTADHLRRWVNQLKELKKEAEINRCKHFWYIDFINTSNIPNEFVDNFNKEAAIFNELDGRCKKPDIEGWTKEPEAIDYAKCISNRRVARNKQLRVMKAHDNALSFLLPYLKEYELHKKIITWPYSSVDLNAD